MSFAMTQKPVDQLAHLQQSGHLGQQNPARPRTSRIRPQSSRRPKQSYKAVDENDLER
jgi:hypothetical protein